VDPIEEAVITALRADSTLDTLAPGGVWQDIAPPNCGEPFVIVTLQAHSETYEQTETTAFETGHVLVKAVGQYTTRAAVKAAAARIYAILQHATITISGGYAMDCSREERIAYVEPDGPMRWQHAGGIYQVMADPT
jgi:hypothetical protein